MKKSTKELLIWIDQNPGKLYPEITVDLLVEVNELYAKGFIVAQKPGWRALYKPYYRPICPNCGVQH